MLGLYASFAGLGHKVYEVFTTHYICSYFFIAVYVLLQFVFENQMRGIIARLAAGGTCLTENTLLIVDFAFPE